LELTSLIGDNIMEEGCWQARIKITQIPEDVGYETILIPMMASMQNEVEERRIRKTWMIDPISDQIGYGLELHLSYDLSWTFFLSADNEKEAIKRGRIFLNSLENKFTGLTGEITVRPITEGFTHQKANFFELRLPKTPLNFKLIEKVMQIFRSCAVKDLKVYIIWGPHYYDKLIFEAQKKYFLESYKVRIFLEVVPTTESGSDDNLYLAQLNGHLKYLGAGIKNIKLEYAIQCKPFLASWREILKATIVKYSETCTLISSENGDFTFPPNCTLKRANILQWKNFNYIPVSKDDPNYILIGNLLHDGKIEKNPALISVEDFRKNTLIAGQTGTGKTFLVKQFSNEFYLKCPLIGVLYLNLGKGNQEYFYKVDHVFKYGDPDLAIPYFVENEKLDKCLQETATYIISSLGLREPLDKVLKTIMSSIYCKHQQLPIRLESLLKALKNWYKHYKYHEEYQTNIMTAFENRVKFLFSDPLLSKTLMLRKDTRIISWYDRLCFGGKIMIDLSMCNSYVKLLLSNALFQIIRTYTPDQEAEQLKILIVIDEAHQIAELPNYYQVNSDMYITRVQSGEFFSSLLREYRSKGISFVIISNSHSNLFPCVIKLSSLRILFRMESGDAKLLTSMQDDQRFLMLLESQKALVLNGNTGERYAIKTIDFPNDKPNLT
jgi:hypothetical protein